MASGPKIVIMSCLFGEQIVKCVVRVIRYINKKFVISIFSELLDCRVASRV